MKYNDTIKDQLLDYIKEPAVLVNKDDVPYEFKNGGSINRLKRRRYSNDMPLQLYSFVIENNITKTQMSEFAGGLILNYCSMTSIYV